MKKTLKLLKKLPKIFKNFIKKIKKLNYWTKTALVLGILLVILIVVNKDIVYKEGFTQREKFVSKTNNDLYDDFYSSIYDDLVYDSKKNKFEINELIRFVKPNKGLKVVDLGCGNGHHVKLLTDAGYNSEGYDKSTHMIERAKKNYPKCKFKNGDFLESMSYSPNTIGCITCFYFTIYYIKDKQTFFQNCYNWLMPGGYLIIHLVNRDKFDPILNAADPLHLVSAQKHAKQRITNSLVKFKDFQYKANFDLDKENNLAEFQETFKDDATGNVRQHKHKLYMDSQKRILSLAKNVGFILKGNIDMITTQYQYQYLYILYKPE